MIIDLLNFCRYESGTEADILFRLQEEGISIPPFFCITEDFTEDELNNYLQNHFQHTEIFALRLSVYFDDYDRYALTDSSEKFPYQKHIPKSAIVYSAARLFSEAREFIDKTYAGRFDRKRIVINIIIQEMMNLDLYGNMHTACNIGLMNESIIYIGEPLKPNYTKNDVINSIYCHNNTDGILFGYEPESAVRAESTLIKRLLEISEKMQKIFDNHALDIKFAADPIGKELYVISVNEIAEIKDCSSEMTILDTKGVSKYYPGVTSPLPATTSIAMSRKIVDNMIKYTRYYDAIPEDLREFVTCINGRMYFNVNKIQKLQDILYLNDNTEEFISPSLKQFINQIKKGGGISEWRKKRRVAIRTKKLLEENLKRRDSLCNKMRLIINTLSSDSQELTIEAIRNCVDKILSATSECMNANQLNTLYINFNKKLMSRLRPSDRKYSKVECIITMLLLYREELCRYHYNFLRLMNRYSLHIGKYMVQKGLLEKPEDIFMLTYEELTALDDTFLIDIKEVVKMRKSKMNWYRSMPGFSQLIFSGKAVNAPVGTINFICTVTDKSHIRGSGLKSGKAEYPAVICKDDMLPEICDPNKIYIVENFKELSEDIHIGGLIIVKYPEILNMNPDLVKCDFPVICGAECANSVVNDGDIVLMDGSTGDINVKHK